MHFATMRKALIVLIATLVCLSATEAAVRAQDGNGIVAPASGAELSGIVSVQGVALHPAFRKWQLDVLIAGDEQQDTFLALGEEPVNQPAELAQLNTALYPDGRHKLRLRVVHSNLNYDEYFTPVTFRNGNAPALAPAAAPVGQPGDDLAQGAAPIVLAVGDGIDLAPPPTPTPPPTPIPDAQFRTDAPADGKRWIEVDISDQALTAWQGDVPVFRTTVSTGKPGHRTLPGDFHIYRKYEKARMTGPDYDTPDVPWTMYYYGGFAIHGAYWHNKFGTPVSHGCVNLRVPEAKALFAWADVGTEVVVHN